jgi:predicted RNase H-like nuclease
VFPAPPRELVGIGGHAQTVAASRALVGRGVSIQAYNIFGRIAAVDGSIGVADQRRLVEVHPEIGWRILAGRDVGSKRTPDGRDARESAIRQVWDVAPRLGGAKRDDVLDALVCAWSGVRWLAGEALLLPDDPPRDARGLLMAIAA